MPEDEKAPKKLGSDIGPLLSQGINQNVFGLTPEIMEQQRKWMEESKDTAEDRKNRYWQAFRKTSIGNVPSRHANIVGTVVGQNPDGTVDVLVGGERKDMPSPDRPEWAVWEDALKGKPKVPDWYIVYAKTEDPDLPERTIAFWDTGQKDWIGVCRTQAKAITHYMRMPPKPDPLMRTASSTQHPNTYTVPPPNWQEKIEVSTGPGQKPKPVSVRLRSNKRIVAGTDPLTRAPVQVEEITQTMGNDSMRGYSLSVYVEIKNAVVRRMEEQGYTFVLRHSLITEHGLQLVFTRPLL